MFWKRKNYTLVQDVERMNNAQHIIDNPLFNEAFDALNAKYHEAWTNTSPLDTDLREKMYLATITLQGVKSHLVSMITTGQIAQHNIDFTNKGSN